MILLDSDVMIDILRNYPPALEWFEACRHRSGTTRPLCSLVQNRRND